MKKLNKEIVVFFHDGTLNGRAGAYAACKIHQHAAHYEGIDYANLDRFHEFDLTGKTVYVIGLSIARNHIDTVIYSAESLIFIDHHPSTKHLCDNLSKKDRENVTLIHSTERASCCLAWSHFVGDEPVPQLFLAIEDVTMNKGAAGRVPNSNYICMGLSVYGDFISMTSFFQTNLARSKNSESIAKLISEGHHYFKFMESLVKSYISRCDYFELLDMQVPVLNIPKTFADSCLEPLCEKAGMAISYVDSGQKRFWSVRTSRRSRLDAGKVAMLMEGGGSLNVGGFTTTTKVVPDDLNNIIKNRMSKSVNIGNDLRIPEESNE